MEKSELPNPYLDEMQETVRLLFKKMVEDSKKATKDGERKPMAN